MLLRFYDSFKYRFLRFLEIFIFNFLSLSLILKLFSSGSLKE